MKIKVNNKFHAEIAFYGRNEQELNFPRVPTQMVVQIGKEGFELCLVNDLRTPRIDLDKTLFVAMFVVFAGKQEMFRFRTFEICSFPVLPLKTNSGLNFKAGVFSVVDWTPT